MKYLLTLYMNPGTWDALSEDEKNAIFAGHEEFTKKTTESGEMLGTKAVAFPGDCLTVRVRDGATTVAEGLFAETDSFLCGYYLVDCETKERAAELAAMIPDARYTAVEVRQVIHEAGSGG